MKNPSSSSSSSRASKRRKKKRYSNENLENSSLTGFFSLINDDLLHNILKRLPATSFSSACCVSRTWNRVCSSILSKPKLSSALFQYQSLKVCVEKAVEKVLSEPIRPQFVIANVIGGNTGAMRSTIFNLGEKLGWDIPIVVSCHSGIMGRDAVTGEFKEVLDTSDEDGFVDDNSKEVGISLTVGFFPGVKVRAFALERTRRESQDYAAIEFVRKIREFSASVSGSISPMAVIMFGNPHVDLKPTMETLDNAMSKETVIVGDERARFVFRTGIERRKFCANGVNNSAVAFVFARDRWKSPGIGEIQFSAVLSSGVSSLGPVYKAGYVTMKNSSLTGLTARREGQPEILDGARILSNINDELENRNYSSDLYIGVSKQRKCSIGSNKSQLMTFLSFHGVIGGDQDYLFVNGPGIRTGDYFQLYCPHRETALSSCSNMSSKLGKLKLDGNSENSLHASSSAANYGKKECIGGFIFSCSGRTEQFLGRSNADSSVFLENFPGVPLAGVLCGGEIGRGISILDENDAEEESRTNCFLHVYSSVYLLVSYTPVPMQH